jgi:hypothetical protein
MRLLRTSFELRSLSGICVQRDHKVSKSCCPGSTYDEFSTLAYMHIGYGYVRFMRDCFCRRLSNRLLHDTLFELVNGRKIYVPLIVVSVFSCL